MAIFGHFEFIPVFLGKLLEKNQNSHFWPFQIYTSHFGKNCWPFLKKFFGKIVGAIFGHSKFIPVFLGKIVQKRFSNSHFWPFQIYTSPFRKNCWKKFGTAIFGHSKFIPVSLGKLLEKIQNSRFWPIQICTSLFRKNCWKNLEWPFLAILNLYQSFWEKLLEKNQNSHFWPFQIYTSPFRKNCWKKFGRAIFGHSKFIPVFLGKFWEKFLAIPKKHYWNSHFWPFQICTSLFGKNCWKKLRTAIFGHSKFIPVFLGKIVGKNSEQPFLAIPNCYNGQSNLYQFGKNCWKKIWNGHFWPFQIYTSLSGKNCSKKFGTAIFGHSKFIAVFLGKIVGKNSEQPFLAIPNLYQSF